MKPDRPALLVSLHDVSPLTLAECREAVALCADAGVPAAALTALLVPRHEDRAPLDEDEPTLAFVRELADAGTDLGLHGFTHGMPGRVRWHRFFAAQVWARGQGGLCYADAHQP